MNRKRQRAAQLVAIDGTTQYVGIGTARKLEHAGRARRIAERPLRLRMLNTEEILEARLKACGDLGRWTAVSAGFSMNGRPIARAIGGGVRT